MSGTEAWVCSLPAVERGQCTRGALRTLQAGGQAGCSLTPHGTALYRRQLALVSVTLFETHCNQNLT